MLNELSTVDWEGAEDWATVAAPLVMEVQTMDNTLQQIVEQVEPIEHKQAETEFANPSPRLCRSVR